MEAQAPGEVELFMAIQMPVASRSKYTRSRREWVNEWCGRTVVQRKEINETRVSGRGRGCAMAQALTTNHCRPGLGPQTNQRKGGRNNPLT